MTILFVHGAGGHVDDRPIADGLASLLGVPVEMPRFSDADMSFEAWAGPVRELLNDERFDDVVVGHSFGATILLQVLAERADPRKAVMMAMPDWSPRGWDIEEYAFRGPDPQSVLSFHHCRDDAVVPYEHLALHAAAFPSARLWDHPVGGHQFDGALDKVAADIRS